MKSGEIGIIPEKLENFAEKEVYRTFKGRDIFDAKMHCINGGSLRDYNKELFNKLHFCINIMYGATKKEYDEEDLLMNIATHKIVE